MFGIQTASAFFAKVNEDFSLLEQDIASPSRGINCILSSYHLHEWVWAHWLKANAPRTIRGEMIRDKKDFVQWLEASCPHFQLVQELANGTKHCRPVHSTQAVAGYGMGPYGIGPYGMPYLLIDLGSNLDPSTRWLVASDVLRLVVKFWESFFNEFGPIP